MVPAKQFVPHAVAEQWLVVIVGVTHHDGVTLVHNSPVHHAGVVRRPSSTPTAGLNLQRRVFVRKFKHSLRADEQLAAEIGKKSEREHINLEIIHNTCELLALFGRIELDFITHDVMKRPAVGSKRIEVNVWADVDGRGRYTEPAGHLMALPVEGSEQKTVELTVS